MFCEQAYGFVSEIFATTYPRGFWETRNAESNLEDYLSLISSVEEMLRRLGPIDPVSVALEQLALIIAQRSRILYYSTRYPSPFGIEPETQEAAVHVVVPFRSRGDDTRRVRNLHACLDALNRQSASRNNYYVTVVEADDAPNHRATIEQRVDQYVHQNYGGPFNRAASLNVGAAQGPSHFGHLCFLDADILPDADFIRRCAANVDGRRVSAMVPYSDMFCLDEDCSVALASNETSDGEWVSGYLIRHPPGACLWLTTDAFARSGGFDERFVGWGGEDRDYFNRLDAQVGISRLPDLLIHLQHERPIVREDRRKPRGKVDGGMRSKARS